MIYDCFLYNGEKECLQTRCEELKELNVTHVLIESCFTFSGKSNTLKYWDFSNLYSYNIKPFLFNNMPNNGNAWDNESAQRNYILKALETLGAKDDDVVVISDADEIPSYKAVNSYNADIGLAALSMDLYYYYFNCLGGKQQWPAAKICLYKHLKTHTPQGIRESGYGDLINNGGWHFSYLGDVDSIVNKLESYSHTEFDTEEIKGRNRIEQKIKNGESLVNNNKFTFIELDESFPQYIVENKDKYSHLIKPV